MQEKLIEILSGAKGWMITSAVTEKGKWRSDANVGLSLAKMEKSGSVESRKSPTVKQHNGQPATEWKLTDKHFPGDKAEIRTIVASAAPPVNSEVAPLRAYLAQAESQRDAHFKAAEDANARLAGAVGVIEAWLGLAAEFDCKSLPDLRVFIGALIARVETLKQAAETQTTDVRDARFFAVHRPGRGLQRYKTLNKAKVEAEIGARVEGTAELYAMHLVDVVKTGAVWRSVK